MPIRFACPSCGRTIKASDDWAGRNSNCPQCKIPLKVPIPREGAIVNYSQFESAPLPSAPSVHATIEHRHSATGGSFRTGFGLALGCLLAASLFSIGGCVVLTFLFIQGHQSFDEQNRQAEHEAQVAMETIKKQAREAKIVEAPSPFVMRSTDSVEDISPYRRVIQKVREHVLKSIPLAEFPPDEEWDVKVPEMGVQIVNGRFDSPDGGGTFSYRVIFKHDEWTIEKQF